jgi:hypothetical protein
VKKIAAPIPRYALTPPEAAASIGVGLDFFNAHVRPSQVRHARKQRERNIARPVSPEGGTAERTASSNRSPRPGSLGILE